MPAPERRRDQGFRRLVLGFDGGCATCSDLARRIEERVGDKLEVRSMHHPQVEHWREQTLGENAPWAPTLFEVGGAREVRAWTGPRMAVRLARALGPVSTWRVMQALGEIGMPKVAAAGPPVAGGGAAGMNRGQFLKGFGGAALALGFLSGTTSPVRAAQGELDPEALAEAFSVIEQIPNSVVARGEQATREWLRRRLEQRFNLAACAWAILNALVTNAIPISKILKIRKAIKIFGGARKFAYALYKAYKYARSRGWKRREALRYAAFRAYEITGVDVVEAIMDLFSLSGVANHCF